MKLSSWNLNGLEDLNMDMRTEAAMFQLLLGSPIEAAFAECFAANTPDIVLLQEVVERSYHAHVVPHLKAAGFNIYPQSPTERSYFEVIAVRRKIIESHYTPFVYSDQGRGLTTLHLDGLTIMTAHLESLKPGASMRIDQAQYVLEEMAKHPQCVFAGDTNLRDEEWLGLDHGAIKDAWESVGSTKAQRFSWQQGKYKTRYGRIWTHNLDVNNFEVFGKENVEVINERPSDHYAMRVEFDSSKKSV